MDDLTATRPDSLPEVPAPGRPSGRGRLWLALALAVVLAAGVVTAVTLLHRDSKPAWRLVWSDEFDGTTLDTSKWTPEDHSTFGEGNKELACLMARKANVDLGGGLLTLRAIREKTPKTCGDNDRRFPDGRDYTSAMLSTEGKAAWHQGRFEMRAKLPLAPGRSKGLWPAFWMRPENGTGDGELDIMEAIGTASATDPEANTVHHTLWFDGKGTYPKQSTVVPVAGGTSDGFHTYAAEWDPGVIRFYVDGRQTFARDRTSAPWIDQAFAGDFYIRLNLAVGGTFPGSPDPATALPADMQVDWVRVYQLR